MLRQDGLKSEYELRLQGADSGLVRECGHHIHVDHFSHLPIMSLWEIDFQKLLPEPVTPE